MMKLGELLSAFQRRFIRFDVIPVLGKGPF
jgi:hypothetical protein